MKTTSAEDEQNMGRTRCSFHGNSMNNLLSYCGLVDARISASEKDLPVKYGKYGNDYNVFFCFFNCDFSFLAYNCKGSLI